MPARAANEAADVTRRYESRELMLELGGLADARPMTCNTAVTITTFIQYTMFTVWSKAVRY